MHPAGAFRVSPQLHRSAGAAKVPYVPGRRAAGYRPSAGREKGSEVRRPPVDRDGRQVLRGRAAVLGGSGSTGVKQRRPPEPTSRCIRHCPPRSIATIDATGNHGWEGERAVSPEPEDLPENVRVGPRETGRCERVGPWDGSADIVNGAAWYAQRYVCDAAFPPPPWPLLLPPLPTGPVNDVLHAPPTAAVVTPLVFTSPSLASD